jgi:hypothetical protein
VCCKRLLQIFVTERIRQVAYVKFVAHVRTPQNNSKRDGVQTRNQQTNEDLKQTRNWQITANPHHRTSGNTTALCGRLKIIANNLFLMAFYRAPKSLFRRNCASECGLFCGQELREIEKRKHGL